MVSTEQAKQMLDEGMNEAQAVLQDRGRIDALLVQLEDALRDVPVAGTTLAKVPLMVGMVKGYINGSYKAVSGKVIATIVAAFLYLVKKNDLIPDSVPVLGKVDDLAVLGLALKFVEPELEAYRAWRDGDSASV